MHVLWGRRFVVSTVRDSHLFRQPEIGGFPSAFSAFSALVPRRFKKCPNPIWPYMNEADTHRSSHAPIVLDRQDQSYAALFCHPRNRRRFDLPDDSAGSVRLVSPPARRDGYEWDGCEW